MAVVTRSYFGDILIMRPIFLVLKARFAQNRIGYGHNTPTPGSPPMARICALFFLVFFCFVPLWATEKKPGSARKSDPAKDNFWAWQSLGKPTVPPLPSNWSSRLSGWDTNPIDRFVAQKLASSDLIGSKQADPGTLLRRLHLDLVGMPPTPDHLKRFLEAPSAAAYEAEVDRLLASRAYAERWARHWLDVARFAESHGFEYDRARDHAWRYRDWVIGAFHKDINYLDFVKMQIAGDLLPGAGSDGVIATGFLVSGPWDQAGNAAASRAIRERAREDELEEMAGTTTQAFLGLTAHCARCHDHKFDPISLTEYHRFKAALAGVKVGDRGILSSDEIAKRKNETTRIRQQIDELDQAQDKIRSRVSMRTGLVYSGPTPRVRESFWESEKPKGEYPGGAKIEKNAIILDGKGAHFRSPPLPFGIMDKTLEAWVRPSNLDQKGGGVVGIESLDGTRFDSIVLGELETGFWIAGSEGYVRTKPLGAQGAIKETSSPNWIHLAATYGKDGTIQVFRNGIAYGTAYKPAAPVFHPAPGSARLVVGIRHSGGGSPYFAGEITEARLHTRALSPSEIRDSFRAGARVSGGPDISKFFNPVEQTEWTSLEKKRTELEKILAKPAEPDPQTYAAISSPPGVQKVLARGDIDRPEADAPAGAFGLLRHKSPDFGLPVDAPDGARRLALAEWIAHPENPLLSRVWVNRVWQNHFGTGLVDSSSDFGTQGNPPTHPELLDFLARFLVEHDFRTKPLHKLILMSRTYQQDSADRPEAWKKDSQSRLLWRYPPRRLDAESIRDSILFVSGQLGTQSGGPGFRPYTTESYGSVFYKPILKDEPAFLARSIYRTVIRSARSPLLEAFDCPDPTVRTARRNQTTTPIQALALMNDPFVQRRSDHLASELSRETGGDVSRAIGLLWTRAYSREPTPKENEAALSLAKKSGLGPVVWAIFNSSEFLDIR